MKKKKKKYFNHKSKHPDPDPNIKTLVIKVYYTVDIFKNINTTTA